MPLIIKEYLATLSVQKVIVLGPKTEVGSALDFMEMDTWQSRIP